VSACENCPYNGSKQVLPLGVEQPAFLVVGEAPGAEEVAKGAPFVGQSGRLLRAMIEEVGGDPNNVAYMNVIRCRPPRNANPAPEAIQACSQYFAEDIGKFDTPLVVALGKIAQEKLGLDWKQMGVAEQMEDGTYKMGGWHPAYVLRRPEKASEFKMTINRAVNGPITSPVNRNPNVVWARTPAQLEEMLSACPDNAWVAFDIETDQIQWYTSRERYADGILMLQICWDPDYAVIVGSEMLYDEPTVVDLLQKFFDRVRTIAHNGKFDCVFLYNHLGLDIYLDFDTMLARYVLDESLPRGLKTIVRLELGMADYEDETIMPYLRTRNDFYSKVPPDILAEYGALDVVACLYLRGVYEEELRREGQLEWPFRQIIMPASNALVKIESSGMYVDEEQLERVEKAFSDDCDRLERKMGKIVGRDDFNPRSPKQVAAALYDQFGLPVQSLYGKSPRTTCHEALKNLENRHPLVGLLLEYRRVHKMRSSYARNILKQIDPNGRVHSDFRLVGTEVGRIAVRKPALQTIPRASDYHGALIRSSFTAPPGYKLIEVDYSQAELRVLACLSGEEFLQQVYQEGRDLHSEVAEAMYGPNFTKEQRVHTKMFNFSYAYGGTEYSFAKDAGLSIAVARKFVRDYNKNMPQLAAYRKAQVESLYENGYVETRFGRRRHFPLIVKQNQDDARKASVHMPVAGGATDLTLMSGTKLVLEHNVEVCLMVHDSVLAYAPEDEAEKTAMLIAKVMQETAEKFFPEVPWPMEMGRDIEIKDRWAEPLEKPGEGDE